MSMSHEEFMTIVRETNTKRQHPGKLDKSGTFDKSNNGLWEIN